jgi:hypothetical protein
MFALFKILLGFLAVSFVASRWVFQGYLSTYKKLQLEYGGRVRNGWVNFPQFILPQDDGELTVSAYPTSGSSAGAATATTCLTNLPDYEFTIVSRRMPNASFWKAAENWTSPEDPSFSSKFKVYSSRPVFLDLIVTRDVRSLLVSLDETRPVRVHTNMGGLPNKSGTEQGLYLTVAAYPNSPDFISRRNFSSCVLRFGTAWLRQAPNCRRPALPTCSFPFNRFSNNTPAAPAFHLKPASLLR